MNVENLLLSVLCGAGVAAAVLLSWRGRHRPLVVDRLSVTGQTPLAAALDALRSIATVLGAGLVAGLLVPGLGGRLVMRVLAATSGDAAQGRLTDAGEVVGDITLSGSIGLIVFVGLLAPAGAALIFLAIRRLLPQRAWIGGLVFGLLLLATVGIDDPLDSDNVDFAILTPLPLAVALVVLTALLFGVTFAALAARLDASMGLITDRGVRNRLGYLSLIALVFPLFLMVALVYVAGRALSRGRLGAAASRRAILVVGHVIVVGATVVAAFVVIRTSAEIL